MSMEGKTAVITGPTSGIGKEIARGLANLGANLVLGCRDVAAGESLAGELGGAAESIDVVQVDISSRASIEAFARQVLARHPRLEVLVNNTKWDGLRSPSIAAIFPTDGVSELPRVGSTELWEIINLTEDAHPMHTHLAQFQILNREPFDTTWYSEAWEAAFGSPGTAPLLPGIWSAVTVHRAKR